MTLRGARALCTAVAIAVMVTLLGCLGGGFGVSYNMPEDRGRLVPGDTEGGYRYNLFEGSWEQVPRPPSEDDIEIRHLDDADIQNTR
ncbi:hypothetical protein D3OALGA1CA_1050 [Olavius algarvensis associated proteobacterium Delta 3]|nr:hypothetical protein D3OALGA1CA_1050 [Olavius algarvensis associated proteobacterium Delta 3]CAB5131089.1 hypothetical protein D3OALGB2SA_3639 [Olavius algarvensis associated proteobacterium Delta 3]